MSPPRVIIIGAGSRGKVYAKSIQLCTNAVVAAVAEPVPYKRQFFAKSFIHTHSPPAEGQQFAHWNDFVAWESDRRRREAAGEDVPPGIDTAFVCVLDEDHRDAIVALGPLKLHIMCEKPLATSLDDCIAMYRALRPQAQPTANSVNGANGTGAADDGKRIFSIGHVLRYSPHNMLLRKLLLEDRVIGDICSVEHTEPVGWWHFAHSYVRGNWRNASISSPSILAKSCHDIDLLMWLLMSPAKAGNGEPHLPSNISSTGSLHYYKKSRKPRAAGDATNCMSCPLVDEGCKYSAKKIYVGPGEKSVETGNTKWPVNVVLPEIEDIPTIEERRAAILEKLTEDYDAGTPADEVANKKWYGRCVYESDNNVCDDQFVTITWDDEPVPSDPPSPPSPTSTAPASAPVLNQQTPTRRNYAKVATLHMVASTKKVCQRYTAIYGTDGEIHADSHTITIENFSTGETVTHHPPVLDADSHGGGDLGLTGQFINAVDAVKNGRQCVDEAQLQYIGCTLKDVIMSHAMVFAAEDSRVQRKTLGWKEWWDAEVESKLM
ncbi:hypothetical protein jhhlp_002320 [Lomentospora prolificans]|uniref:Gfo/Idh/MocA-like oxidoreductase N-terminal domain-containing protein n=1 Tax=Lomentospora prolificans TaxID=41688 RepID=A0A2N3NDM2_9PEZI|nr:hypothetical protein jhhlp_002320 [Lomentospora prolificans]